MPLLVQSAHNTGTGTGNTVTLGSAATLGNCLVVAAGGLAGSAPSVSSVKVGGSADNFALAKKQAVASFTDGDCEVWTDQGTGVSSASVVTTFSASQTGNFAFVMEWSGINSTAVDKTNSGSGTTSSFSSGSSGALASANEVIIGASLGASAAGTTAEAGPASPWTNLTQIQAGSGVLITGYQVVSATTAQTYSGTVSGGNGVFMSAAVIVTLKAGTLVSDSDTGSGADTATVSVSDTDTGSGTESGSVAAALSSAETGPGADSATVGVTSADTGTGADTAGPAAAAVAAADTGSGAEGAPSVAFTAPDTGSAADAGTAVLGASGSDTGTGAESSSISVQISGSDTGTGAESSSIAATLPASADTGTGADTAAVGVASGDTGSGAEHAVQAPFIAPPVVLWRAPDYLSKTGGTMR